MAELSFESGQVIGDRYRLESKLGEGGMGAVWRAEHVTLRSPVAVKFINPGLANTEEAVGRFMLEARSSAALRSSHIVQVFDFGVDAGVPYIAMELLEGESLAERLRRERRLSFDQALRVLEQAGRAVSYAHTAGIVHRDLKPDNVFLAKEGDQELVKVLDFGIAKVLGGGLDATTGGGTRTGALMGTPYYVSPEQARGNKSVDQRTDVWALGVIAYECLVGDKPFESDGLGDLLMKICGDPHDPPSARAAVPPGLDRWMDRALAKRPEDRFASVTEMVRSLVAISAPGVSTMMAPTQLGTTPDPESTAGAQVSAHTDAGIETPVPGVPSSHRRGILWGSLAAAFMTLAALAIGYAFAFGGASSEKVDADANDAEPVDESASTPVDVEVSEVPAPTPDPPPTEPEDPADAEEDEETDAAPPKPKTPIVRAASPVPAPPVLAPQVPSSASTPSPPAPAVPKPPPPVPRAPRPAPPGADDLFPGRK